MTTSSKTAEALRFCPSPTASTSSSTRPTFKGHTLLLPTISHASIPQLATDLLLSTGERLSLVHAGSLDVGQDLIPFIGGSDSPSSSSSSSGGISTPLDVFTSTRYPLTVLQQRSPVLRSRRAGFAKRLARWIKQEGFAKVVVLSSLDAALRDDEELGAGVEGDEEEARGGMMHYLASAEGSERDGEEYKELAAALKKAGPPVSSRVLVGGPSADQDDNVNNQLRIQPPSSTSSASRRTTSSHPHLPSSSTGLTSRYLSALSNSDATDSTTVPVPSGALLLWAAEGDNRGDAHRMARCVLEEVLPALGVETVAGGKGAGGGELQQQQPLNEPPSWRGLYGNAYNQALFG